MGHVRRRVVNQGVLNIGLVSQLGKVEYKSRGYSHALNVELVTTRQAHDLADTVDIFLQANDTLDLPAHILLPLTRFLVRWRRAWQLQCRIGLQKVPSDARRSS